MSDSVWPHRWQPTRLPRPWDSPGKNTGVGCHFLLQCRKVKSEREVAQSCPTLSDPMNSSQSGSFVHGIFQARVLEWGAIMKLIKMYYGIIPVRSIRQYWFGVLCLFFKKWHHSGDFSWLGFFFFFSIYLLGLSWSLVVACRLSTCPMWA